MKLFTLSLCTLLSLTAWAQETNNNNEFLAENTENTSPAAVVYKEVVIPGNIKFTTVINNLPEEAIEHCIQFSKRTNYINGIYKLSKTYFPKINKAFAKMNVPTELNVLIALESYFNKNVVSRSGAVGFWQFMDATAVEYGLSIDSTNDERKDFTKSTKAAAKYLKDHYKQFNDWYLTVASYNAGGGTVRKAMAKSGKTNPNFFDIKPFLPKETQNYVMNYIALNIIFKNFSLYTQNKMQWHSVTKKVPITEEKEAATTTVEK
jgi:soluble lytic murein transglycosylase-like protein